MFQIIGLGHIRHGTGTHATPLIKQAFLGGEHHDPARHVTGLDPRQHLKPVQRGHDQIQYHQLRFMFADHRQDFVTVGHLVDLFEPLLSEQDFHCSANHRMIVRYQR
ncbi:hypothetical protein D3C85_1264770 [compost metagenome]